METNVLRPLPPFRAKPARKPLVPKASAAKDGADAVAIKAPRLKFKVAPLRASPALKVLGRAAD
jgi:hypothetical protein